MAMEFGWWNRDPEEGKFQVRARIHGGNLEWRRKQGHHTPWRDHRPSAADWDRLVHEAERRLPRRLISPRQLDEIRQLRETSGF